MAVNAAAAREFLQTKHRGMLATLRKDGMPQLSPIVAAVDHEGRVMISTREPAMKVKHVRRDPRVSLAVFTDDFFGPWIQVEGRAEVVALPEAMDVLIELYRRIGGEHDDWNDYRRSMQEEQRVVIRFAIDRAGPNVAG